ncbi:hypothetical protein [Chroococcidiopsis cubana]|uniref:hypothetical protein n=1 Tax=Chroococcidiopsis cubana TaxID=171392 RepID=UPI002ACE3EDD|nr:hypothetical protein [Chroococcidiopsis cubana]
MSNQLRGNRAIAALFSHPAWGKGSRDELGAGSRGQGDQEDKGEQSPTTNYQLPITNSLRVSKIFLRPIVDPE